MSDKSHQLTDVPGVGPATAQKLRDYGIHSVADLRDAIEQSGPPVLVDIDGFGRQTLVRIKQGLDRLDRGADRPIPKEIALTIGNRIVNRLENDPDVNRVQLAGSLRRGADPVGDIDVLIGVGHRAEAEAVFKEITDWRAIHDILGEGSTKLSILVDENVQVDFRAVEVSHYGAALQYFTGPMEHNIALRRRAKDRGMKLSEYGLFDRDSGEFIAGETEPAVYEALELRWPDPSERTEELSALEV